MAARKRGLERAKRRGRVSWLKQEKPPAGVEKILLFLTTYKDGRRSVGGVNLDGSRDWMNVFIDCLEEIIKSGRAVDILLDGKVDVLLDGKEI